MDLMTEITIFVLAAFVGFEVISKVPTTLHTPLMSQTNAIHGIVLLGGLIVVGLSDGLLDNVIGTIAIVFGTINVVGGFLVVAYNLELAGGRFHTDFWFAASWGAFPALTSWWANTLSLEHPGELAAGLLVAAGCFGLSVAQRRLSTPVRVLRRGTASISGEQRLRDGTSIPLSMEGLASPLDGALRAISWALVALAAGLVALRL